MPSSAERADLLVDTSVAVPLVQNDHPDHDVVVEAIIARRRGLAGHAVFETFSVLTRIPPPDRLSPMAAVRAISHNFAYTAYLGANAAAELHAKLATLGIAGGAVYDALVGAAALEHDVTLATRDERALRTYRALNVRVELIG